MNNKSERFKNTDVIDAIILREKRKAIRNNHPEEEIKFADESLLVNQYMVLKDAPNQFFDLTDFQFNQNDILMNSCNLTGPLDLSNVSIGKDYHKK